MADIINIKNYKPENKKDSKESDLAMFAILWFQEHFDELLSDLDLEVKYALVISAYRFMIDAEASEEVEIGDEGFSISQEASQLLKNKIQGAIDFQPKRLN